MTEIEIVRFFTELRGRLRIIWKCSSDMDLSLSTRFSVFKYFRPNENDLSDIFADILSPNGLHGQKEVFLKIFCKHIGWAYNGGKAFVFREKATDRISATRRRIDILIEFDDEAAIIIENKPWANDQEDQLADYWKYANERYKGKIKMVYMPPSVGMNPDEKSLPVKEHAKLLEDGSLVVFPYKGGVSQFLNECRVNVQSQKYGYFLEDLCNFVNLNF